MKLKHWIIFSIVCLTFAVDLLAYSPKRILAQDTLCVRRFLGNRVRRVVARRAMRNSSVSPAWRSLFDGKTLTDWKITNFGGEGEVTAENGEIAMDFGSSLTGVTYTGEFPRTNYEVQLEAKRVDGIDFFCGMTFPVGDSYCSFIIAGWAGAVVGLSSIDGKDASDNQTTRFMNFENNRWYRIRVRVTAQRIEAWIDDKQVVNQNIVGRRISTRNEVDLSKPFGISAWETRSALRNIQIRRLHESTR